VITPEVEKLMKKATLGLLVTAVTGLLTLGSAQEVSSDAVRIGVLNDQSGLYADLAGQGSVTAARMAVEDFGGQVLGKPIEILSADHQNKPDVGSNIVRQWIDTNDVDVIVDVPTSSVALAVQEITRENNRVFLISGAASTDLTGAACSPTSVHWTYDTYALAVGTGRAMVEEGGDSWFFITADYAFGHSLEENTARVVRENGGEVVGTVRHPLSNADFSSYLLQAQGSGAEVIGLANAGADTTNAIKQANEFGIVQGGQQLAGLLLFISDVHSLGLDVAEGLVLTTGFYWDMDEQTREWSQRFFEQHGAMPTMVQAGVYSSVMHYLKAIEEAGTDEAQAVVAQMKEMPVNDFFARNGQIRADGRLVYDMYLAEVKTPSESEGPWDYYNILRTIPGDEAYRPLAEGGCPLVGN
jgi:branched-chain amino acid transport system substrate-binding protein